jgi:polyhydroxyalkanoate synthesis regulator phasin
MSSITQQALKLLVAVSMTEKDALTEKLTALIEQYRNHPEKSEEIARLIMQFLEKQGQDYAQEGWSKQPATREDISRILLELQLLKKEVAELKSRLNHA